MSGATATGTNPLLERLFERLANRDGVHFKHQTRDEPDLTFVEKMNIAREIYEKSPGRFLSRFHQYLTVDDTVCFSPNKDDYEVAFYLKEIASRNVGQTLRNRRYAAMDRLMKEGHYFSDYEMKQRDPALFEELIGRYDPGASEKLSCKHSRTFSEFLLDSMDSYQDKCHIREVKDKEGADDDDDDIVVDDDEDTDSNIDCDEDDDDDDNDDDDVEDIEDDACDGVKKNDDIDTDDDPDNCSEASAEIDDRIDELQKEMYRQEFLSVMQERFIRGKDEDFDYEALNGDLSLDDHSERDRDLEEHYFDEEEPQTPRTISSLSSDDFPERLRIVRAPDSQSVPMTGQNSAAGAGVLTLSEQTEVATSGVEMTP